MADLLDLSAEQTVETTTRLAAALPKLNQASVRPFDAYDDVGWDTSEMSLDPTDSRLELFNFDPLAGTEWYRGLPPQQRARLGCDRLAATMTVGWQFENLLQRGLLNFSLRHHQQADVFRYLQHEIAEEAQHTLMFREFARRTGSRLTGMPKALVRLARAYVVPMNQLFPELFFIFVLAGEDPADWAQRRQLDEGCAHPLVERIMRIHVTEESRHLSFARTYLLDRVPKLGPVRRMLLAIHAPIILGIMARMIVYPAPEIVAKYQIPKDVLRESYGGPQGGADLAASVAKPRRLLQRLGVVPRWAVPLWRYYRIWETDNSHVAARAA